MTGLGRQEWFATLLLPWILATGWPSRTEAQTQSEQAQDAVGILLDNQDRCLELSYGRLDILEADYSTEEQSEELGHYLREVSRANVRVAKKALEITHRLVRGIEDSSKGTVRDMLDSQQDLCEWAMRNQAWNDAAAFQEKIRGQGDRFAAAQSALPPYLQLNSTQRRQVIQKYRQQLFGASGGASGDPATDFSSEVGQIGETEYQRKKKAYDEWLADQERREAEKVRRQAQRRAEMAERSKQEPRKMPKLELNIPGAPEPEDVEPEAMAAWHGDYSAKITPFKQALAGYLKARAPNRTVIMFNACIDLARASEKVLEDPTALEPPDSVVAKRLREAVTHFKRASDACVNNRLKATRAAIADGERALGQAIQALKPYDLGL